MFGSLTPAVTPLLALNHCVVIWVRLTLPMSYNKLYWSNFVKEDRAAS